MNQDSVRGLRLWHKNRILWLLAAVFAMIASQLVLNPRTGLSTLASLVCIVAAGVCLTLASVSRDPHEVNIGIFSRHLTVTQKGSFVDIPWEDIVKIRYIRSIPFFDVYVSADPELPAIRIDAKALSAGQISDLKRTFRNMSDKYRFAVVHMNNF